MTEVQSTNTQAVDVQCTSDRDRIIRMQRIASGNQSLAFCVRYRDALRIRLRPRLLFSDDGDIVGDQLPDRLAGDFVIDMRHRVLLKKLSLRACFLGQTPG
ncbi:hypothetical protein TQ36_35820 (plasmid) [Burkholderia cenocepacia]|nr:hypothetical protein TQ36_35820 [Burkholderia cenocepacia]